LNFGGSQNSVIVAWSNNCWDQSIRQQITFLLTLVGQCYWSLGSLAPPMKLRYWISIIILGKMDRMW
jgi:hypothetical protein